MKILYVYFLDSSLLFLPGTLNSDLISQDFTLQVFYRTVLSPWQPCYWCEMAVSKTTGADLHTSSCLIQRSYLTFTQFGRPNNLSASNSAT